MRSAIDNEYSEHFTADQDRELILGSALLFVLEEDPDGPLAKQIMEYLDEDLTEKNERILFNLSPKLDYNDKLRPLKPPR